MTASEDYRVLEKLRQTWTSHEKFLFMQNLSSIWACRGIINKSSTSQEPMLYEPGDYTRAASGVKYAIRPPKEA